MVDDAPHPKEQGSDPKWPLFGTKNIWENVQTHILFSYNFFYNFLW